MPSHEWASMGKQDFSCQMWLEQGGGGREGIVCPWLSAPPLSPFPSFPNPPPDRGTEVTRGPNPPSWESGGRGMGKGEGRGRVRGQPGHNTSQLLERPLGEWTESFPLSPTPLIIKCC